MKIWAEFSFWSFVIILFWGRRAEKRAPSNRRPLVFVFVFVFVFQDWERLSAAFRDMQSYWVMLERKRRQLEEEQGEERGPRVGALPLSIRHVQLDLRDLMNQVSSQVSTVVSTQSAHWYSPPRPTQSLREVTPKCFFFFFLLSLFLQMKSLSGSWVKPTAAASQLNPPRSPRTLWDSRVEGYVVLRDLDLYLTKLARDFLLLASKDANQNWKRKPEHAHTQKKELKEKKR